MFFLLKYSSMKNEVLKVLKYFSFFDYSPRFKEIYTFLPKKTTKKELKRELEDLVNNKIIENWKLKSENGFRYTLGEYSIKSQILNLLPAYLSTGKTGRQGKSQNYKKIKKFTITQFNNFKKRYIESEKKLKYWKFRLYIKLLSLFPQIKLVGLSGSIAMMNADKNDDIDIFIITAKNRLFTGRFLAIILAKLLGIHRKRVENIKNISSTFHVSRYTNKVCLNLFFDEGNLEVPDFKKTKYVAHEILQMKPVIVKGDIYQRFLKANSWVFNFFPNAKKLSLKLKVQNQKSQLKIQKYFNNFKFLTKIFNFSFLIFNLNATFLERMLKSFQLYFINRHKTTEFITNYQLWFHPEDFGKKIKY